MKLYFTCPIVHKDFATDDYSLEKGHTIAMDESGKKQLIGFVSLNSGCPLCGRIHSYEVKEVMCPISRGENEG